MPTAAVWNTHKAVLTTPQAAVAASTLKRLLLHTRRMEVATLPWPNLVLAQVELTMTT
jgi:hypothetical protein